MLKRSGFDTTAPLLVMVCLNVGEEVRGGYGGRRVTVVVVGGGAGGGEGDVFPTRAKSINGRVKVWTASPPPPHTHTRLTH